VAVLAAVIVAVFRVRTVLAAVAAVVQQEVTAGLLVVAV
jgi:hypothetical protein